jgi:hypothetical protein
MTTKQISIDFYQKLKEFDNDPNKTTNINYVKEILYKFSYCDLEDAFDNPELIRKSVINYLYTGKFKLDNDTEITKEAKTCLNKILAYNDSDKLNELIQQLKVENKRAKNATITHEKKEEIQEVISGIKKTIKATKIKLNNKKDFNDFYSQVHVNWENIHSKHNKLIEEFVKQNKKVKYLIVYEAPPYEDTKKKYFLNSNRGTYGNPIKECFSNSKSKGNISTLLIENDTIYFDLIMAGIPIADAEIQINKKPKPIRYFWSTNDLWKIGEKQLPIILLELGIFHLLNKGVKFDKRPFIAIGTPLNTSSSLFEYYSKNYMKVHCDPCFSKKEVKSLIQQDFNAVDFESKNSFDEFFTANLSLVNTPSTFEIRGTKGETYPLFKSNIIGSSNYPHGNLLKNAFNII